MAGIIRLIYGIFILIFLFIIPAIPGAVLWWFLKPVMFWEKFAWAVTSMIFYATILAFIGGLIWDWSFREEGEETVDENEE